MSDQVSSPLEPGTFVTIAESKTCDFDTEHGPEEPAVIDGKTVFGPWANMCQMHFDLYGVGLGVGFGQRLIVQANG